MTSFSCRLIPILFLFLQLECFAFTSFKEVSLLTNDLVYDPNSDMIYASVPSAAGAERGNTITPIDPHTGLLGSSVFVASEPSILALADDGSRIYVASESTNLVTPFSLATMTPGTAFPIGTGDRRVDDMEVAPGDPTALAVSRRFMNNQNVGIAVFVNGVQLPNATNDNAVNDVIEFGSDSSILYGHSNSLSDVNFNSFAIDLSPTGGVGSGFHVKFLLTQTGLDMEYENGRMYFTNGQVLEVNTPGPIGSFTASGPVEPVASTNRTYFIHNNSLKSFNQSTFVPLGTIPIHGMSGSPKNLISLGDDGIAFATTSGQVFIARGSLVQGPTADFDEDGDIDGLDFLAWQGGFGMDVGVGNVAPLANGNANGDHLIDAADLAIWETQYGSPPPVSAFAAVPEPTTATLALAALCLAMGRRRF